MIFIRLSLAALLVVTVSAETDTSSAALLAAIQRSVRIVHMENEGLCACRRVRPLQFR